MSEVIAVQRWPVRSPRENVHVDKGCTSQPAVALTCTTVEAEATSHSHLAPPADWQEPKERTKVRFSKMCSCVSFTAASPLSTSSVLFRFTSSSSSSSWHEFDSIGLIVRVCVCLSLKVNLSTTLQVHQKEVLHEIITVMEQLTGTMQIWVPSFVLF